MRETDGKCRKRWWMCRDWLFTTEKQSGMAYDAYQLTKAGAQVGPAARSYDDHTWQRVELPHDFVVTQDLDAAADNYNGYLKRPDAWYRRYFQLDATDEGKRVLLHFGGISGNSEIYLNGCLLKKNASSYLDVTVDISDYVYTGTDMNVLAVHMDNSVPEGWWYQGGGLYRPVWLEIMEPACFDESHLQVVTEHIKENIWQVRVNVPTLYRSERVPEICVRAFWEDQEVKATAICSAGQTVSLAFETEDPRLWDIGNGQLYPLVLQMETKDGLVDSIQQMVGFREFRFDADAGFFLNGKHVKLKGLCFHEDEGNLGWAIDASVYERRLQELVAMGGNAYRCSHNAPDPVLLDLCDRYGILVMDETRKFSSAEDGMAELTQLICRDRNHPSIVLWSLGNEETLQGTSAGKWIARSMKKLAHTLDPTRPVTLAMHQGFGPEGAAGEMDVIGVNYNHEKLDELRAMYPDRPFLGTEVLNLADMIVESGNAQPGAVGAWETLTYDSNHSFYAGTFGWAGADYRGEHRNLAFFTDACPLSCNGTRKDGFYRYQARWTDTPLVHICGHWNPDSYAKNTPGELRKVQIISNLPVVKLYVNGTLVKTLAIDDTQMAETAIAYAPGVIRAEGYPLPENDHGEKPAAVDEIQTSGLAHHFVLHPEKQVYPADGTSRMTFWIEVKDENGIQVPMAVHNFRITCEGDARIVCTDNADPYCSCFPEPSEMGLYKGRGKAVLQAGLTEGNVRVTVTGEGILPAACEVVLTAPEECLKEISDPGSPFINDWFVSRIYTEKPDIYEYTTDDNYAFWRKSLERATMVEQSLPFFYGRGGGGYVIYCMEPNMPPLQENETGKVVFEEITGSCEILISMRDYDNRILKRYYLESTEEEPRSLSVELPGVVSDDRLIIKLLIRGTHSKCGLTGPVRFA